MNSEKNRSVTARRLKKELRTRRSVYTTISMETVGSTVHIYRVVSRVSYFGDEKQFRRYFSRVWPLLQIRDVRDFEVYPGVRVKFRPRAHRVEITGTNLRTVEGVAENFGRSAKRAGLLHRHRHEATDGAKS
ncbi:MAG: hypothetical protein AB7F72_15340 [Afipia sp.]